MSTAVAAPPAPSFNIDRPSSPPRSYSALAPSTASQSIERDAKMADAASAPPSNNRSPPDGKSSPNSTRTIANPKVIVKKEPASPSATAKHRPRKLDLHNTTASTLANTRPSAGPLTGRDVLAMQDVGLACLSPGFQTQDPTMREQLQRSISVRDQQRSIIEARMLKSAKGDGVGLDKAPPPSAKKRPPPAGLSIVPPSAQQFANERVIQSAPLNQTFTGRDRPIPGQPPPPERPTHTYASSSQVQHVPAVQTNNRLPPIADVFGSDHLQPGAPRPSLHHTNSVPRLNGPPLPSPGFPPQTAHPHMQNGRPREYRSAEEAVHELTGGREDLQPKIIRYGGRQPPTPPSPRQDHVTPLKQPAGLQAGSAPTGRRRSRNEYEADSSPPLGAGREHKHRTGPFGEGRDSPATTQAKKEEFLSLCARAWDLFHS